MIYTTLTRIRDQYPCKDGWRKLLAGLGKTEADDYLLPYARIVEINGIEDALWACRAEPKHAKEWRLFAVWCARQVEHLMTDESSKHACDVAERYAYGQATDKELAAAWDAAWTSAWTSLGPPIGQPIGQPLGQPQGPPHGTPQGPPLGQSPGKPQGTPLGQSPGPPKLKSFSK